MNVAVAQKIIDRVRLAAASMFSFDAIPLDDGSKSVRKESSLMADKFPMVFEIITVIIVNSMILRANI